MTQNKSKIQMSDLPATQPYEPELDSISDTNDGEIGKTHFPFHIWFDANGWVEGFAEIPGKAQKLWYSHLSFRPKRRITEKRKNPKTGKEEDVIVAYETTNSIYDVVSSEAAEHIIDLFRGQRYFAPLRNEVRSKDAMGRLFIQAEDPYLDGEPIWGYVSQETKEWVEIQAVGSAKRAGDFRFLKH